MTISSTVRSNSYVGSGTTGPFAYGYRIFAATDLVVTTTDLSGNKTVLSYPADYSVTGVGLGVGGSITLTNALTSGYGLTVERVRPLTQETEIRNQGAFFAETHEDVFDNLTMIDQQQQAGIDASLKTSDISSFVPDYYLRVNAAGTGVEGTTIVAASQAFLQSGSGAVSRTMNAKASEHFTPMDFGCIGNGSVDDSANFTAAASAAVAANRSLYLPAGYTFKISPFSLNSFTGLTIRGDGDSSVISITGGAVAALSGTSVNQIRLENFKISGTFGQGVALASCTRCVVTGLSIAGATQAGLSPAMCGVLLSACTNCIVKDNYLSGNGPAVASDTNTSLDILIDALCVQCKVLNNSCLSTAVTMNIGVQNSSYILVSGNRCNGAITNSTHDAWGYGIYFYSSGTNGEFNLCIGNHISNTMGMGIYLQTALFTSVIGNILVNTCTNEITSLATGAIGANILCADCLIANNQIIISGNQGIRFDCVRTTITGNRIMNAVGTGISIGDKVDGSSIVGNIIKGCAAGIGTLFAGIGVEGLTVTGNTVISTLTTGSGITFDSVNRVTIASNVIESAGGFGINVSNSADGVVSGNVVKSASQSAGGYDGIQMGGGTTNFRVTGNVSSGALQPYGFRISGSGHEVTGNSALGNATGPIIVTGTNVTRTGNRVSTGPRQGTAVLVAGTVTVATAEVLSGDTVLVSRTTSGGTPGNLSVPPGSITTGVSFIINSSNGADTSTIYWEIVH